MLITKLITGALAGTVLIPLLGAFALVLLPFLSERRVALIALVSTWASSIASLVAVSLWLSRGLFSFHTPELVLVSHGDYHFVVGLVLDVTAAVFLLLVQFTSGTVIRFSRVYLHREPGFARFFAIVLMFRSGMCLLALADHLDLLFVGWELVGLSSFLLIAFYHERGQAVRNALKTFSVYRVADVGMLLGAYLEHTAGHTGIGLLLLLAAAGKSAQFPFSFWISRAMEGPTPSSALFYGALSVHAGAYLLLRTYPIWGDVTLVHVCIGALGLLTAILCTIIGRAQHTVKGQVGYASVTQVGLIFVELSLGLRWLALVHIFANALLRCYQLLVSPSAVAYLLRQQSSTGAIEVSDARSLVRRFLPTGFRSTLYAFAISEGYLEGLIRAAFWNPLRVAGNFLARYEGLAAGLGAALATLVALNPSGFNSLDTPGVAAMFTVLAILFSVISLSWTSVPAGALAWVGGSGVSSAMAVFVALHRSGEHEELIYSVGVVLSYVLVLMAIAPTLSFNRRTKNQRSSCPSTRWPKTAQAFVGVLGMAGFPVLPTFFLEDILLHGAFQIHRMYAVLFSALFAFNGYLAMRAFASSCFGSRGNDWVGMERL